jgi:uncharacterized protein YjiK
MPQLAWPASRHLLNPEEIGSTLCFCARRLHFTHVESRSFLEPGRSCGTACRHLHGLRLDARALLWLQESLSAPAERAASLWLPGYRAVLQVALPGLESEELSDLAYNPASGTLFAVSGKTPLLIEISTAGEVLRRMPVSGASNLEGVAVLEGDCMAIADERQERLSFFRIAAETKALRRKSSSSRSNSAIRIPEQRFEGLAWDKRHRRLLLGKEKHPVMVYGLASDGCRASGELHALVDLGVHMTDLAALTVDPRSGHIVALSQESHLLVELDEHYDPRNFIALLRGLNGLEHNIPQAEGVALDEAGNLYLVSERNLFYVFRKVAAQ